MEGFDDFLSAVGGEQLSPERLCSLPSLLHLFRLRSSARKEEEKGDDQLSADLAADTLRFRLLAAPAVLPPSMSWQSESIWGVVAAGAALLLVRDCIVRVGASPLLICRLAAND